MCECGGEMVECVCGDRCCDDCGCGDYRHRAIDAERDAREEARDEHNERHAEARWRARPMRIGVTGGRDYDDLAVVIRTLRKLPHDAVLIHGAAPGADTLCTSYWVRFKGRAAEAHPADWDSPCGSTCKTNHRRPVLGVPDRCPAAGPLRNQAMVDSGLDLLIAFPGGRGTADMTRRARSADVPVLTVAELSPVEVACVGGPIEPDLNGAK